MITYFDTSAFVKLLLEEPGTEDAQAYWRAADVVVASTLLYVEARAAVSRARRGARVSRTAADRAVGNFQRFAGRVDFVAPTRRVVWRAAALAEVHALRGYDAVHLASALDVGEAAYFVTSDRQLANAARAEGFPVYVPV